jgi:hypothetical protein
MKYLLIPLLALFLGVFLTLARVSGGDTEDHACERVPDYSWNEIQAIWRQRDALQARGRASARFLAVLDAVKAQLWQGRLTLAAAADTLEEASRRDNPTFLAHRYRSRPELPRREALALALLAHLRVELEDRPARENPVATLAGLRGQLLSWPGVSPATLETLAAEEAALRGTAKLPSPLLPSPRAVLVPPGQVLSHREDGVHHPDADDDQREDLIDRPELPAGTFP